MSDSQLPAIPDFATLAADPEIAPLLGFEPVVRKVKRPDGWTPELQRELIARIAATGTVQQAVWQMGKHATGAEALYKTPSAEAFRKCWDAAIIIGRRRNGLDSQPPFIGNVPGITRRSSSRSRPEAGPLPGQMLNEHGEWEDEESLRRRGEEAKDSISRKLLNCRRLYLREISSSPGKRAAFEILTELPIDWEKAARLEAQPDEPFRKPNMRKPDMLLTAENGWSHGECGYGPDKKAALRAEIDKYREEEGLPAINWDEDDDVEPPSPPPGGEVRERGPNPTSSSPTLIGDPPSAPSHTPSPKPDDKPGPSSSRRPGPRLRRI
jgi:hypothetical protein